MTTFPSGSHFIALGSFALNWKPATGRIRTETKRFFVSGI
jgi:hypothetical protein